MLFGVSVRHQPERSVDIVERYDKVLQHRIPHQCSNQWIRQCPLFVHAEYGLVDILQRGVSKPERRELTDLALRPAAETGGNDAAGGEQRVGFVRSRSMAGDNVPWKSSSSCSKDRTRGYGSLGGYWRRCRHIAGSSACGETAAIRSADPAVLRGIIARNSAVPRHAEQALGGREPGRVPLRAARHALLQRSTVPLHYGAALYASLRDADLRRHSLRGP